MKKLTILIIAVLSTTVLAENQAQKIKSLENKVAILEKRVLVLEKMMKPFMDKQRAQDLCKQQQLKARQRMRQDRQTYSYKELKTIEQLYQVANKKWRSEEGKNSLEQLIEKYKNANRTGCAYLYLGQMNKGKKQISYLENAIKDFSDCYYGNGVQVGAYARFILASIYIRNGQTEKALKLINEIKKQYPDAIDHKGRNLVMLIDINLDKK